MKPFITKDFLLQTEPARKLYHDYAAGMPIIDYHCHLSPKDIAGDRVFENLTQAWLEGDHYKWRAMRSNGIGEEYCTGNSPDAEKFKAWASTVPHTLRNPLYHWTHLELKNYFGIDELLNPETADSVYQRCSEKLNSKDYSVRNLLLKMNVRVLCTTDDPIDSLEYHKKIREDGFKIKVLPSFRPDKGMMVERPDLFNEWVDKLSEVSGMEVIDYPSFIAAIMKRHDYFHEMGCRLSDHGLEMPYAADFTEEEITETFATVRSGKIPALDRIIKFKSAMLVEFGCMDHAKGWVQQFHLGVMRNNNTRRFKEVGPDTGFDSIGDFPIAGPLSRLLDRLDQAGRLAKTILYNINPRDNEVMATMPGNFMDGTIPGKIQYGSGWWFLDQKDGMEKQINALSNLGLLSRFVGMLTDSRSFLSYPRHEYFRRILCNLLGSDMESGLLPDEPEMIGEMVKNICYNNIREYMGI